VDDDDVPHCESRARKKLDLGLAAMSDDDRHELRDAALDAIDRPWAT
jgi:hypothetical protein